MRSVTFLVLAVVGVLPALAGERIIDFSKFATGQTPPGFQNVLSGQGKSGEWKVIENSAAASDPTGTNALGNDSQVLAQLSQDGTDERFPMLILEDQTFGDFTLTTRFKIVDGLFEQMAGIAFRIKDTNNYYYVRASALGNTFRFIKLVDGQRLTTVGPSVEIPRGVWHELKVECQGNRISLFLNGKQLIPQLTDNTFASGKIGFWTKSDSVSYFGRTHIAFTQRQALAEVLVREALDRYPRLIGLRIYCMRDGDPKVVASNHEDELALPGSAVERDVIQRDVIYYGKEKKVALVTMPLHDRNGEVVGAVRVVMQSFPGQTEQNAVARARPVIKEMEKRIRNIHDLLE